MSDRAADVLAPHIPNGSGKHNARKRAAESAIAALLACTPDSEPVVITAEGRLMRLESAFVPVRTTARLYRLTPLEPSPKETP